MTTPILPENILKCMNPVDRKPLGKAGMTSNEAKIAYQVKSERDLQNLIGQYLSLRGIVYMQSRMDKRTTGTKGWPDFTFAYQGKPVALEVKMDGCKPTEEQTDVHRRMRGNGWLVYVVTKLEEVKSILGIIAL